MAKIETYILATQPLSFGDMLIGTEINGPIPNATKNFSLGELYNLFATLPAVGNLQQTLNAGNTATQNIFLTGNIQSTNIQPQYIIDGLFSTGAVGEVLIRSVSGISWGPIAPSTLQTVLDAGNVATQNITLTGNITSTKIIPGNIQDGLGNIGTNGQVLYKSATGLVWSTPPVFILYDLQTVLDTGNTATQNIVLNGYIKPTSIKDNTNSNGVLNQVLSIGTGGIEWITIPAPVADTLQSVLNAGNTATQNIILNGYIKPTNIKDNTNSNGTLNQILTIGSGGLQWVDQPSVSPLIAKGDLYTFSTVNTRLPIGLDTQVLIADSSQPTGLKWSTNTAPTPLGYYGSFSDITDQFAAVINTGYPMLLGVTDLSNGVTVVSGSRVTIANTGVYNIQWSAQFRNPTASEHDVTIWLRKNGIDVPGSSGIVLVPKKHGSFDGHTLPSWNFLLDAIAGDYYEFVWSTQDTGVFISFELPIPPAPSTASVVLTVTQQSGIMAGTGITAINGLTSSAQTMVLGSSGTDFNLLSVGSTHTFNLPTASSINRGALSSTDWSTFNSKQGALTLTTTGTSGASTLIGTTLNIPNYAGTNIYNSDGTLTGARTLTLNSQPLTISGTTSSRFFANGNVGIGTTTDAGYKLDVAGIVRLNNLTRFENDKIFHNTTVDLGAKSTNLGGPLYVQYNIRGDSYCEINQYAHIGNIANFSITTLPSTQFGVAIGNRDFRPSVADNTNQFFYNIWYNDRLTNTVSKAFNIRMYGGQSSIDYGDLILQFDGTNKRGNVLIGTQTNITSAILNVQSTTQGVLPPRMTTTQRDAIASPATGLQIYNTTLNTNDYYNGTSWISQAVGNIYNSDGTLTGNRTLTSGGYNLTFTGTNTASGAIARGLNLTPTLVAAANNDTLVGLDINPTFNNGAFTGINSTALRVNGKVTARAPNSDANGEAFVILQNSATFPGGAMYIKDSTNTTFLGGFSMSGNNVRFADYVSTGQILFYANGSDRMTIYPNGNVGIGTLIDSGYKLDISGGIKTSSHSLFSGISLLGGTEFFGPSNTYFNGPTLYSGNFSLRYANAFLPNTSVSGTLSAGVLTVNGSNNTVATITGGAGVTSFRIANTKVGGGTWFFENNRNAVGGSLEITKDFGTPCVTLFQTSNISVGSFVDAGYKLDVNGTTRFSGNALIANPLLTNNILTLQTANNTSANIIRFSNQDGTAQGGLVSAGSSFGYGTYQTNQCNLTGGTGGIALRVGNGSNANIRFYSGNSDGDFSTVQQQMFAISGNVHFQNAGTYTDIASARVAINSTTQGFLPPRMTTTQRDAIASPEIGLMVYDTTVNKVSVYNGTSWKYLLYE